MAEFRLKAEYGDYLAYTCTALKGNIMDDLIWKVQKLDWQEVVTKFRAEEALREQENRYPELDPSPSPYLDDLVIAASRFGYDESLVRYQILAYADRTPLGHKEDGSERRFRFPG